MYVEYHVAYNKLQGECFMSTKELAYSILDSLSEEQLKGFIMLFSGSGETRPKAGTLKGALSEYANPDLIPLEKEAWANAAAEKYKNSGHLI